MVAPNSIITPVTVIDLQATYRLTGLPVLLSRLLMPANSNRFQYGRPIIYSIFSCLVPRNCEFLAKIFDFGGRPLKFLNLGMAIFLCPKLWTRFTPLVVSTYRLKTADGRR